MEDPMARTPFLRHMHIAESLLSTLRNALMPYFAATGTISWRDFDRGVSHMLDRTDLVAPMFANACRRCVEEGVPQPFELDGDEEKGRRRDFVTRLVFSHVVDSVPECIDPMTGDRFPRNMASGVKATLMSLFYDMEWAAMNSDAITIFRKLGTTRDEDIRHRIDDDETLPIVAGSVFVRVALRFRQFAFQRQAFIRRMSDQMRGRRFSFTDEHFVLLFEALIGRLRADLGSELGRARFDMRYGEATSNALLHILDEFDQYRTMVAPPPPARKGPHQRAMRLSRPVGMSQRLVPVHRR